MAKIWLDHADGRYSTRQLTDEEAAESEARGGDVVHLEDRLYESYLRHLDRDYTWQAFWRAISNEQCIRRRAQELQPLEDLERENARLKEELARAQRMESFYEEQYERQLSERHREKYVEFTCVYPQPECQIDLLPSEWIERANEILAEYDVEHAAEGMKYQGCCCGHTHKLLDDEAAQKLRDGGFIVENDTETL